MPSIQRFLIQQGDHAGKTIDLVSFPFTIGRSRDCSYVIDSTEISRLHARCTNDHLNIFLEDMGSTNGTFVNGRRLGAGELHRLRAGDAVSFAQICVWIFDDPVTTAQIDPVQIPRPALDIDLDTAQVFIDEKPLDPPLSPNQFSLLALLIQNAGRIVTREQVIEGVWGGGEDVTDQTIDALVSRLRKRLLETDPTHDYLVTRRGFGLMFQNRRAYTE
ncbi:MAG: FHA domain-containing protein [Chloroflexi bacterium]|nr:FHA domain-containing protein [Chloroflexota bacterium]